MRSMTGPDPAASLHIPLCKACHTQSRFKGGQIGSTSWWRNCTVPVPGCGHRERSHWRKEALRGKRAPHPHCSGRSPIHDAVGTVVPSGEHQRHLGQIYSVGPLWTPWWPSFQPPSPWLQQRKSPPAAGQAFEPRSCRHWGRLLGFLFRKWLIDVLGLVSRSLKSHTLWVKSHSDALVTLEMIFRGKPLTFTSLCLWTQTQLTHLFREVLCFQLLPLNQGSLKSWGHRQDFRAHIQQDIAYLPDTIKHAPFTSIAWLRHWTLSSRASSYPPPSLCLSFLPSFFLSFFALFLVFIFHSSFFFLSAFLLTRLFCSLNCLRANDV